MIKFPFFKKKMVIFKYKFSASLIAGSATSVHKKVRKLQNFLGVVTNTRIPNCVLDKPNLLANTTLCSDSSQYAIFFQSLVKRGPDILMKVFKVNKFFQSGASLKMPPSSPFMKEITKNTLKNAGFN